ncbi:hypothetical protein A1O7_02072 [Cladophialophora yegresii CBS 114405]|uniref:DUF6594 domain-containing protein n=1 Tax=Cladophialophora yegresii CBS 114405 TaxID=1182544 RepID=W9W120_9EURO|nr:uncharacterized protein A1O7_02072 [Cladophialophora yegresii CBS 114405]EXJ61643.1 hypothetical protein A1O7_02072 [Cladophialophora yegresii CBS 114405]
MEAKLDWLDRDDARSPETQRYLSSRREDGLRKGSPRKALFQDIESQLEIYDSLLQRSAQIYQLEEAPNKHRQAVVNHIWSDGTLKERDREYIQHADDLVYLNADTEASWVHWFVGYLLYFTGPVLMNRFRTEVQRIKLRGDRMSISLYEKKRFNKFVNVLFTIIIVTLVMGPVMVLYTIRDANGYVRNATAVIFTASFALLCATATNAKRQEVFAVTAA